MRSLHQPLQRSLLAAAILLNACGGGGTEPTGSITLAVTPPSASITQGVSGTAAVSVTRSNFSGDVQLTAEGLPAGISASFAPATLGSTQSSAVLTISATTAAATGAGSFTVRARGTGVPDKTATVSFTIAAAPAFTMTLASSTLSLSQGASGTVNVALARTNFTGAVTFAVSGLPSGASAAFAPNGTTADASVLTINTGTAATGTYNLTVTGSGSGLTDRTASLTLTITAPPSYTMTLSPTTATIGQGASGTVNVTLARTNFTGAVALTASGLPTGATASFSPASLTGDASVMTINTGTAAAGTYSVTVTGTATGLTNRTATLSLVIPAPNATVYGNVRDLQSFGAIAGATLTLKNLATNATVTQTSSATGAFQFTGLAVGTYSLSAVAGGYQTNTAENLKTVSVAAGDVVRVDFSLPPTAMTAPVAGLSGRVLSSTGTPIAGATVTISGGAQTNGVFKSTTTASDGTYALEGITLVSSSGSPITSFTVTASKAGYDPSAKSGITLQQNKILTNVDFSLATASGSVTTYFSDGFESALAWTVSGFWNRTTGAGIANTLYPTYVNLAPDDASNGALPLAPQGSYYLWYGQPSTGSFIGSLAAGDYAKSGGTSDSANAGTAVSSAFTVGATATNVSLNFDTWFEIESVNPNSSGFDLMIVSVVDVASGVVTELARLNPYVDPEVDTNREPIPFTSGGFNRAPVFRPVSLDMTAFKGKQVKIHLEFRTEDHLFNGFRGWIVDNVRVTNQAALGMSPSFFRASTGATGRAACTSTCPARRR